MEQAPTMEDPNTEKHVTSKFIENEQQHQTQTQQPHTTKNSSQKFPSEKRLVQQQKMSTMDSRKSREEGKMRPPTQNLSQQRPQSVK